MPKPLRYCHHVTARFDDYLYQQMNRWALMNGVPISVMLRLAVASFLTRKETKQGAYEIPDVTPENTVQRGVYDDPIGFYNG